MGSLRRWSAVTGIALAMLLGRPAIAEARILTWTLSGSAGFGFEVHPNVHAQATNIMATLGLGLLADMIRPEIGVLAAYGALATHYKERAMYEFRPMLRLKPPVIPLYARLIFSGINPFDRARNFAYGGALGLNIPLGRLGVFAEAGTLPRRLNGQVRWILEARLGVGFRL